MKCWKQDGKKLRWKNNDELLVIKYNPGPKHHFIAVGNDKEGWRLRESKLSKSTALMLANKYMAKHDFC